MLLHKRKTCVLGTHEDVGEWMRGITDVFAIALASTKNALGATTARLGAVARQNGRMLIQEIGIWANYIEANLQSGMQHVHAMLENEMAPATGDNR